MNILNLLTKIGLSSLVALIIYYALWVALDDELRYFWPFSWGEMFIDYAMCFAISLIVSIAYWRSHLRIQRERDKFKFLSLKNQINPHFVFNNFSILSELIEEDPKRAQTFLMNLSKLYRYNLSNIEKPLVSVKEELKFLNHYVHILESRFGDSFVLDVSDEVHDIEGNIPPCSLQMLVENALKHNAHTRTNPLHISITSSGQRISVTNNKQPLTHMAESANIGNHNLQERYSLLSHKDIIIRNTTNSYTVSLPILK